LHGESYKEADDSTITGAVPPEGKSTI